jgi:V/A-type H+-transporting ATPase subunit E
VTDLTVFRDAVLAEARRAADALLAETDVVVDAQLDAARTEAEQLRATARAHGREAAEHELRRRVAEARQEARGTVLRARRDVLDELRDRVVQQLLDCRGGADYEALCDRLGRAAREQLGADAAVDEDHAIGGVVGSAGGRRVDYRLPVLVDRALEDMAGTLEELWR